MAGTARGSRSRSGKTRRRPTSGDGDGGDVTRCDAVTGRGFFGLEDDRCAEERTMEIGSDEVSNGVSIFSKEMGGLFGLRCSITCRSASRVQ